MAVPSIALIPPATHVQKHASSQVFSGSYTRRSITAHRKVKPSSPAQASHFTVSAVPRKGESYYAREERRRRREYVNLYEKVWGCPPWKDPLNEDEYKRCTCGAAGPFIRGLCQKCYDALPERREASNARARERRRRQKIEREAFAGGGNRKDLLPIGPLRKWVEGKIVVYGGPIELARACKIDSRRLRALRHEQSKVTPELVDHMLTNEGSTMLWELYEADA